MTETRRGKMQIEPRLDPFRERQVSDVAGRFNRARREHERQADLMWLGTMAAGFSDHELKLLEDLGFLCPNDRNLMRQAGRPIPERSGKRSA